MQDAGKVLAAQVAAEVEQAVSGPESHTPGPWRFEPTSAGCSSDAPYWITDGSYRIADIRQQSQDTRPNARLIAAAPDLLSALEEIAFDGCQDKKAPDFKTCTERGFDTLACDACIARAAIAKATK